MARRSIAQQKVETASVPAPIGGLNARDSIAKMPETDAIILDNYFANPTDVSVRNGCVKYATTSGSTNTVETIMAYNGAPVKQLFAIDSAGIHNVTNGGATTPVVTGLTNARFQYVNFPTPGGHFIYAVNGIDPPELYDGTTWHAITTTSTPYAITGVTPSTFINVNAYAARLWFVPINGTGAWYLPVNSISGAATFFDVSSFLTLGGYIMGSVTWTVNYSSGQVEYQCFVSSEGEVIVYTGTDPSSSTTFQKVAQFRIGRPVGRRFYQKVGGDIVMITADGVVGLNEEIIDDRTRSVHALSNKIVNLINNDVSSYNQNFGWQILLSPIANKLIVNVPQTERARQYQYVMNTINQSWSTFGYLQPSSAWNANCFELFNDIIYFGGYVGSTTASGVYRCDIGYNDNGNPIVSYATPAFSYFKRPGQQKFFTMARPVFSVSGSVYAAITMSVDFENRLPDSSYQVVSGVGASAWNISPWNTTPWSQSGKISKDWQTVNGIGFSANISITMATSINVAWESTDYAFQLGGIL